MEHAKIVLSNGMEHNKIVKWNGKELQPWRTVVKSISRKTYMWSRIGKNSVISAPRLEWFVAYVDFRIFDASLSSPPKTLQTIFPFTKLLWIYQIKIICKTCVNVEGHELLLLLIIINGNCFCLQVLPVG